MVERLQVYEAKDGRRVRVVRVLGNGMALTENIETGRRTTILEARLGKDYQLLADVK